VTDLTTPNAVLDRTLLPASATAGTGLHPGSALVVLADAGHVSKGRGGPQAQGDLMARIADCNGDRNNNRPLPHPQRTGHRASLRGRQARQARQFGLTL